MSGANNGLLPLHHHRPFLETVKNKHEETKRAGNLNHIKSEASGFADIHLTTGPEWNHDLLTWAIPPDIRSEGSKSDSRESRHPRAMALHIKSNDRQPPSTSQEVYLLALLWRLHKFMHGSSKYVSWTVIRLLSPEKLSTGNIVYWSPQNNLS